MNDSPVQLLHLENLPILEQLRIEEALVRADHRAWCLLNIGSPPAIVMGISGKPDQLIHLENYAASPIPVFRRFSGGGCVAVDQHTVFFTFIAPKSTLPCPPFPQPIIQWTADTFFQPILSRLGFNLQCQDFAIGDRKFGGNAQYIRKDRFLHHSTLLWDYHLDRMNLLTMPPKTPEYRIGRNHSDFLCCLKEYFPTKQTFIQEFKENLKRQFDFRETTLEAALAVKELPHRKTTAEVKIGKKSPL